MVGRELSHHSLDFAFEISKRKDSSATTVRVILLFVHSLTMHILDVICMPGLILGVQRYTKDLWEDLVCSFTISKRSEVADRSTQ